MIQNNRFLIVIVLLHGLILSGLIAGPLSIKKNKYPNGPQKDWNQRQFAKYYRSIERYSNKTADLDDQILRIRCYYIRQQNIDTDLELWFYI